MKSLRKIIEDAGRRKVAIGHFNISDLAGLKAIIDAASELKVPVFIGTSEGEAKFLNRKAIISYIKSLREELKLPIFVNSDHTHSLEEVKKAVAAGYDAILFDGGTLPLAENIKQTKKVVAYVRSKNKNILVEGELGNIGSGSSIRKELPKGAAIKEEDLTTPDDALKFVKATGVDMLAPAVGNLHGMLVPNPSSPALSGLGASRQHLKGEGFAAGYDYPLNIKRIKEIKDAVKIPLVLHGGSGNTDSDFLAAIDAGVDMIHISTELRLAWRKGLERSLAAYPEEIAPYKLLNHSVLAVREVFIRRLRLFNKL